MTKENFDSAADPARGEKRIFLFGLAFEALTLQQAGEQVARLASERSKALIVTPNVDHIVSMEHDREMHDVFVSARYRYADGMPLVWLSRLMPGRGLPGRVTGADLLPKICELASARRLTLFFLGGQPGEAQLAAQHLAAKYEGLQVNGTYCPPFGFENDNVESASIVEKINALKPDILFIGVGTPKQEKWAAQYLDRLDVGPVLGIGGAFAFHAGTIKRAPALIRNSGLEWLWRLGHEPRRLWRRYLVKDMGFIRLALRELVTRANR